MGGKLMNPRFRRPKHRDGQPYRWQQVAALEAEGLTLPEIAERLEIDERHVWFCSQAAAAYRMREEPWATTWERKARQMAEVYEDPVRRRWIYRQMGLEYDDGS